MPATAAVMVATLVAVGISLWLDGRVPALAIVTLVVVLILGGASLLANSEVFIKLKPTVVNCLIAGALAVGLFFQPTFLERLFGSQISLIHPGWRVLTLGWIVIALLMAVANELVWRNVDTDSWVAFKTALAPVAIVAYGATTALIAKRYWREEPDGETKAG